MENTDNSEDFDIDPVKVEAALGICHEAIQSHELSTIEVITVVRFLMLGAADSMGCSYEDAVSFLGTGGVPILPDHEKN